MWIRKLADKFRSQQPTPQSVGSGDPSPAPHGARPADSRRTEEASQSFNGNTASQRSWGISRPEAPPTHDTRTTPTAPRPAVGDNNVPYGVKVAPRRDNRAFASERAHQPSEAGDANPKTQAADDGRLMRERGRR